MSTAFYVTHPQVAIDPAVPVPDWGLSDRGRARTREAAGLAWTRRIGRIVSSTERKAVETATILAEHLGLAVEVREAMHENDRSATGFLPPPEFEATADLFFAHPDESIRGWERARDAQRRIVAAVEGALKGEDGSRDVCFVGHGGVGTLLYCHLAGEAIARRFDQAPGGGNRFAFPIFAFDSGPRKVLHGWRPFDQP
ncbi:MULTISPECIES: histidine phosphatase family protein [unclassified Chelatococcus]|uniref:histidine phosphatase family protein n=1 Tax=unclassified Chelatococcus TaxID=2638111 RepID=UPI0002DE3275|nr:MULTISPECIES: histidine phosphatase family protein [unclassified Chelatococcus]ALA17137.1 phosphoglycerate mutase [Chelatococcus sp. CO-6]